MSQVSQQSSLKSNEMSLKSCLVESMSSHHSPVIKDLGLIGLCRCVAMQSKPHTKASLLHFVLGYYQIKN